MPRLYLLDIEGTVSPISFVYDVLFPYARARLPEFLTHNWNHPEIQSELQLLAKENQRELASGAAPPEIPQHTGPALRDNTIQSSIAYLFWLMDRDRKSTALKSLQGKVWAEGYERGELLSMVFADVAPALERWHKQSKIAIYSSGSVEAQKNFFAHTNSGDLSPFLNGYFDTRTGPKTEMQSYLTIAAAFAVSPAEVLFISDSLAELDAARQAAIKTALSIRPGNPEADETQDHRAIRSFDEL
ncbi:MAG TPA: acireductone synthase [Terriglobales bacterium]|nr:acireductone synthase [Terriglobales bacterium]